VSEIMISPARGKKVLTV